MSEHVRYAAESFYDGLVEHGLIVPVRVQGAFGRGAVFEDVLERFNALVDAALEGRRRRGLHVPAGHRSRRSSRRRTTSTRSRNLAGTVFSFFGKEQATRRRCRRRCTRGEPWGDTQGMTDVVLNPAACYPVYPSCQPARCPQGGRLDHDDRTGSTATSRRPSRRACSRSACASSCASGTPDEVVEWRDMWLERGARRCSTALGLPAKSDVAADPFFGRGGKMLAAGQKEQKLKFEVLVPGDLARRSRPPCCSFNYHQDHFGARLRHPDRRRQRRAHRVPRLRPRARRDGAVQDARLRSRRRGPRPCARAVAVSVAP